MRISLNGIYYRIVIVWNDFSSNWNMDIADDAGNYLVRSVPLVAYTNLLEQFNYLGVGGKLATFTDNNSYDNPTFDNLGTTSHLYFITP